MFQRFEQALAQAVSNGRIAGGVALIADRDGVLYEHAAGVRAIGAAAPMDAATVFWIASMTKAVVSVAALQLVERGELTLDGDLTGLVPDFKDLQVLTPQGLRPAKRGPTLRQLLTHTSGFAYGFTSAELAAWIEASGFEANGGTRASLRQPLLFDPGQGWIYGIGIDWAGLAVEAASGQRLDAYLREHILAPLAMPDTGFIGAPDRAARTAGVHVRGPEGGLVQIPFGMPADPEVLAGGAGLYSTARDYGRFLRMLLNGGELEGVRVLSGETVRGLSQVQTGERRAGYIRSAMANMSNDFDLYPQMATGHGLATMVTPQATAEGRGPGSLAWGGLANTYYWADPAAGKAGVLLTQLLPFGDPEVLALMRALERDAYGTPWPTMVS
ncbi:serine hydrolase domain-containing protein [Phenylobacterium sp.]|uniref:serine hydrolase domain-containing protein n=1 Tax=Phenylobacterium sp. TaxID=1871053 RepID=UPI002C7CFDDD|nr:serine hydrolase domain-containing protein [Phenylobacterium sp.]HLZ76446.1 serine hydrolase domain-containing protein [Phenylobacterium sp.]